MDQDQLTLISVFCQGSAELLTACEESLMVLEARPSDGEALNRVLRNMHRLKGDSMLLDLVSFSKFAHVLEELLVHMRSKLIPVSSDVITFLLQGVDTLRKMASSFSGPTVTEKSGFQTQTAQAATPLSTVRVETEKLDRLVDLTGEIAINRRRLTEMLEDPLLNGKVHLLETHQEADRLFMDLQEIVLQTRMVPLGPLFRQQTRALRDMAGHLGKQVALSIEGDNVEVDTLIANSLRDPITHTLRNAIDHGIETPSVRASLGKNPVGKIHIKATREAGSVMIEIVDDGGGLVREKIRAKIVTQRLVDNPNKLTDRELCDFIFRPGFSTTEVVSEISGRGVGMDIVRRNIEALNGTVQVESEEGKGTRIILRLPLTLAIIQGFGVGVGNETYVLPLETVKECVALPEKEKNNKGLSGTIDLRGDALSYINLGQHFGVQGERSPRPNVVIVKWGGRHLGLCVDEIFGEGQAVVKPLPAKFQGVVGISGATITGGGRVALILDVAGLMRRVEEDKTTP